MKIKADIDNSISEYMEMDNETKGEQENYSELPMAYMDKCKNENILTYDMVQTFVEKILLNPDKRIEIKWKIKEIEELKGGS